MIDSKNLYMRVIHHSRLIHHRMIYILFILASLLASCTKQVIEPRRSANSSSISPRGFGGDRPEYGYSISQAMDGGYLLAGKSSSFGPGEKAFYVRTDPDGNLLWGKIFSDQSEGVSFIQTTDSAFVLLANHRNEAKFYLSKLTSSGTNLWTKTFDGIASQIVQTVDGQYLVAGNKVLNRFYEYFELNQLLRDAQGVKDIRYNYDLSLGFRIGFASKRNNSLE